LTNEVILWYDYSIEEVITMNNIYVLLVVVGVVVSAALQFPAKRFYEKEKYGKLTLVLVIAVVFLTLAIGSFLEIIKIVNAANLSP